MPHKCTKCGRIYPDGDRRILNGCECGNNRFIYVPKDKSKDKRIKEKNKDERLNEDRTGKGVNAEGVESVRIIDPGMYEINLEKVFSREEIIIALREDGRYVIHLPSLIGKLEKKLVKRKSDKKK
jgi:predicted  nucleic acid-binding Zn-ribbon protein